MKLICDYSNQVVIASYLYLFVVFYVLFTWQQWTYVCTSRRFDDNKIYLFVYSDGYQAHLILNSSLALGQTLSLQKLKLERLVISSVCCQSGTVLSCIHKIYKYAIA